MPSYASDVPPGAPPGEPDAPFRSALGSFDQIRVAKQLARNFGHDPRQVADFVDRYLRAELEAHEGRSRDPLDSAGVETWPKNAKFGGSGVADGSPAPARTAVTIPQGVARPQRSGLDRYSRRPR